MTNRPQQDSGNPARCKCGSVPPMGPEYPMWAEYHKTKHGLGQPSPEVSEPCPKCNGAGKVTFEGLRGESICLRCDGTGVALDPLPTNTSEPWKETMLKAYTYKAWQMFQLGATPDEVISSSVFGEATQALSSAKGSKPAKEPAAQSELESGDKG